LAWRWINPPEHKPFKQEITIMNLGKNSMFLTLIAALVSLFVSGCASKQPRAWNVSLVKTTPATIRVDIIGVRLGDKAEWAGLDINKYWSPGSKEREEAEKVSYNLKTGEAVTLAINHAKWNEWLGRGAHEILVIADLPGDFTGRGDDPRRKFLPLRSKDWDPDKKNTIELEVKQTGIRVKTRQIVDYK
jgi:hypothetical protein